MLPKLAERLPPEIARSMILRTDEAADFCGIDIQMWRRMDKAGELPRCIQFSERVRGWRLGDLVDWIDKKAAEQA